MIGILAGMGPKSTAPFLEKVVMMCQLRHGAKDDMDFPPMMVYSCPTPFYLGQSVNHALMEEAILAGVRKLAATGVSYIAIPCNLAHIYFDSISSSVATPIFNMVEETLTFLPADCKRVAVLATSATIESGIYQQGIRASNRECILTRQWQIKTDQVLAEIKRGVADDRTRQQWGELVQEMSKTVSAAIIACTDLNVVADTVSSELTMIDSSVCLAQAVADRYYQNRNCRK